MIMPACSGSKLSSEEPAAADSPASPSAKVTLTGADTGTSTAAKVGDQLEVQLESPGGVAPEYGMSWADKPVVDGAALRLVRSEVEPPPEHIDGGSTAYRYHFEAVAPGKATIRIDAVNPGEQAEQGPWTVTVDVSE
ncbi:hypothetical protein DB30_03912 [Enhygromyxa salina]|uniref:Proteinase inhibitor I42 chagasin domain-containing protein n=2 Tax=Enhygromyxa salina TaxID=215803 RepID=A0A0C2A0L3_9BACT|nr:hypothetical protein DB30_03912 [Enhygromyxa salina]